MSKCHKCSQIVFRVYKPTKCGHSLCIKCFSDIQKLVYSTKKVHLCTFNDCNKGIKRVFVEPPSNRGKEISVKYRHVCDRVRTNRRKNRPDFITEETYPILVNSPQWNHLINLFKQKQDNAVKQQQQKNENILAQLRLQHSNNIRRIQIQNRAQNQRLQLLHRQKIIKIKSDLYSMQPFNDIVFIAKVSQKSELDYSIEKEQFIYSQLDAEQTLSLQIIDDVIPDNSYAKAVFVPSLMQMKNNILTICYGQTGAGKSTLIGAIIHTVFGNVDHQKQNFGIRAIQNYLGKWYQLCGKRIQLVNNEFGQLCHIKTENQFEDILKKIDSRRTVRDNHINPKSSRGHVLLNLVIDTKQLFLFDLCGRQKLDQYDPNKSKDQILIEECKFINNSLHQLKQHLISQRGKLLGVFGPQNDGCLVSKTRKIVSQFSPKIMVCGFLKNNSVQTSMETIKFLFKQLDKSQQQQQSVKKEVLKQVAQKPEMKDPKQSKNEKSTVKDVKEEGSKFKGFQRTIFQ